MTRRACPCGSGLFPTLAHDARLIPLGYVCNRCEAAKMAQYRPEVLTDPFYDHEEPLDDC